MASDPYAILEQLRQQERAAAANNVALHGRNPAEVARAKRLADRFGVSTPLVETQPEVFESAGRKADVEREIEDQPWMAKFLVDNPDTAAMFSTQDLSKSGNVTRLLQGTALQSSPTDRRSTGTALPTSIPQVAPKRKMGPYRTLGAEVAGKAILSSIA
ncbi:MAG: hypothetical protein M3R04_08420, partial [bacterium]|nr:hypothetical protein [bacterium]